MALLAAERAHTVSHIQRLNPVSLLSRKKRRYRQILKAIPTRGGEKKERKSYLIALARIQSNFSTLS